MGVDTRVFIGRKTNQTEHNGKLKGKAWFQVYAVVEMCGWHYDAFNALRHELKGSRYPEVFVFDLDGNKTMHTDCYGEKMKAVPFNVFYEIVKRDYAQSKDEDGVVYRRLAWLRSLMAAMNANHKDSDFAVTIYEH